MDSIPTTRSKLKAPTARLSLGSATSRPYRQAENVNTNISRDAAGARKKIRSLSSVSKSFDCAPERVLRVSSDTTAKRVLHVPQEKERSFGKCRTPSTISMTIPTSREISEAPTRRSSMPASRRTSFGKKQTPASQSVSRRAALSEKKLIARLKEGRKSAFAAKQEKESKANQSEAKLDKVEVSEGEEGSWWQKSDWWAPQQSWYPTYTFSSDSVSRKEAGELGVEKKSPIMKLETEIISTTKKNESEYEEQLTISRRRVSRNVKYSRATNMNSSEGLLVMPRDDGLYDGCSTPLRTPTSAITRSYPSTPLESRIKGERKMTMTKGEATQSAPVSASKPKRKSLVERAREEALESFGGASFEDAFSPKVVRSKMSSSEDTACVSSKGIAPSTPMRTTARNILGNDFAPPTPLSFRASPCLSPGGVHVDTPTPGRRSRLQLAQEEVQEEFVANGVARLEILPSKTPDRPPHRILHSNLTSPDNFYNFV